MVFFNEKKFACRDISNACIKGHRSSGCKHTDRPLFEIKKKGRPVTQCDHCRELRKTKQVHVRCQCGSREDPTSSSAFSKRSNGPPTPAFPNGLTQETLSTLSRSKSLSSASATPNPCLCEFGEECRCWTPRSSYKPKTRRNTVQSSVSDPSNPVDSTSPIAPPNHHTPLTPVHPFRQPSFDQLDLEDTSNYQTHPLNYSTISEYRHGLQTLGDQNQEKTGTSPSSIVSQLRLRPEHYNVDVDYLNLSSAQPPTSQVLPLSTSPICNCGLCHCPDCSEHISRDGFPTAAPTCSVGCSSGLGCVNDHPPTPSHPVQPQSSVYPSSYSNLYRSEQGSGGDAVPSSTSQAHFPSTPSSHTFSSASYTTLSLSSHLDGSVAHSHAPTWSSDTTISTVSDSSRRTSFAVSGERDACPPLNPHHILDTQHSDTPISPPTPYPSTQSQSHPFGSGHQVSSPRFPLFRQHRNTSAVDTNVSQATSLPSPISTKPSVVKRSIQRLLPRNTLDSTLPIGSSNLMSINPQHQDQQLSSQSTGVGAAPKPSDSFFSFPTTVMPYNRLI